MALSAAPFEPDDGLPVKPIDRDPEARMAMGMEIFKKDIRPILAHHCVKCHGGETIKGKLDLTDRDRLLGGGESGPAVVPGKSEASRLIQLVTHAEEPHMPFKGDKLPDEAIARLAAWIDLGAPYDRSLIDKDTPKVKEAMTITEQDRQYWAFQPLQRVDPPRVENESWCRTAVDRFILAKLDEKELTPNPPVDRRKLIRRAYFDLIGLPPTPEEVEAFSNDASSDAYEKLIDRLLENPHFGERWARHWLDLARFAESHGYEQDYDRPNAYHYRDFVIKAFNQDLPYDTFVKWQIAGDEFEPENPLAMMATGFLAAGTHATQITANQAEKERYDELDDMVRTIGTTMLGLTIGCARCHDHKFDPIPNRDYYRLISTFSTTVRSDLDVNLDPKGYQLAKAKFDAEHAPLVEAAQRYEVEQLPKQFDEWLAKRSKQPLPPQWIVLDLDSSKSVGGATFTKLPDGSLLASGKNPDFDTYTFTAKTSLRGITAVRIEALAHESFVKGGPGRADNGNIDLTDFRVTATPLVPSAGKGAGGEGAQEQTANQTVPNGKSLSVKLTNPKATFEQGSQLAAALAIDNDKKTGWAVDPQFGKDHAAVFETESDISFDGGALLEFTLEFNGNIRHNIGRPRISVSTASRPVGLDGDAIPQNVQTILATAESTGVDKLADDQRATLLHWYRHLDPPWLELDQKVLEHAKAAPKPNTVKALVSGEGVPAVRLHTQGLDFYDPTYFLKRGDPNQKGEVATPSFLQVLMRCPEGEKRWQESPPSDWRTSYRRRSLANWLTDVDQGAGHLLARVIVNRLWQHHIGRGIVATPSDFGRQGQRPSHPELLDWLAAELISPSPLRGTGRSEASSAARPPWSLKHIHKLIMTSAAYMQGSQTDEKRAMIDRDNTLVWRHPGGRLEAEVIRDAMLAACGSLDSSMFGSGTLEPNHRRRSIYFFVKRSKLIPMMTLFDAPDSLQDLPSRSSTTIAPQALMLMNSATIRDYAVNFARRIQPQADDSRGDAVRAGYLIALSRMPTEVELADSVEFLTQQSDSYIAAGKPDAAELALADFCQTLMSLNEFVYVE